jgi:sterol O-acyltransferase
MPVIVYEVEYPRSAQIRVKFAIQKALNCILAIIGCYLIVTENILPVVYEKEYFSIIQSIFNILLPVFTVNLLVFWMVFENYLNFFGEITRFGDRLFYLDWWNSNGVEDLNRRWNRPVHMFLYRHFYMEMMDRFHMKSDNAKVLSYL